MSKSAIVLPFDLLILPAVEAHDARRASNARLRLGKDVAEAVIEAPHGLARELQVLELVVAHGHDGRLVDEDVGAHEHRVREERGRDVLFPVALLLELRHAVEVAHRRHGGEVPRELGVLAHVALHEERAAVEVQPAGDEIDRGPCRGCGPQLGRLVLHA